MPLSIRALTTRAIALSTLFVLAGCGVPNALSTTGTNSAKTVSAMGIPSPSQFVTIKAVVTQLLPDDNSGLPHQNFIVQETAPNRGVSLEVNNDTHYGSQVQGLHVGESLVIRGVIYTDPRQDGIHWTHHANRPGDAGYIETPDGHIYQ